MSVIKKPDLTDPKLMKKPDLTPKSKLRELAKEEMGYNYYGPKPAWCYGLFSTIGSNWFFI